MTLSADLGERGRKRERERERERASESRERGEPPGEPEEGDYQTSLDYLYVY